MLCRSWYYRLLLMNLMRHVQWPEGSARQVLLVTNRTARDFLQSRAVFPSLLKLKAEVEANADTEVVIRFAIDPYRIVIGFD